MARQKRENEPGAPLAKANTLLKVATRIAGLDEILEGGIPEGRTTLVSGGPGSGKSNLGIEFLYRGALDGEPGIFVTFEERADAVRQNALTLGWDLASLEEAGMLFLFEAYVNPETVRSGDFTLKALFAIIEGKAKAMGAKRIVIDALDILLRLFDDSKRERNELYALHDWLDHRRITSVLTVKASQDEQSPARYEFLDFMVDCVIHLDQRITEQISTRRIRVLKYRGSGFGRNEYPFAITENGLNVVPISTARLEHKALGEKISAGHPRLDAILGGGYRRASSILITGTSGTGKTTLASTFVHAACGRGEKVLYISFEESQEAITGCMLSAGIDLRPAQKAGTLDFLTAMPEAFGAEEHLVRALKTIDAFQPDYVVIDAISACKRMGSEQAGFDYVMRMVNACKKKGVTVMLLNQTNGFMEETEISGIGISSLVDTVLFLRYVEVGGEINRTLLVMKSRGSKHVNQYREFLITDQGIDIVDVYVGEGGVLTGAARQEQEAKQTADCAIKQQEIDRKEREIAQMRVAMEAQAAALQVDISVAEGHLEELTLAQDVLAIGRDVRATLRGEDAGSTRLETVLPKPKRRATTRKEGSK